MRSTNTKESSWRRSRLTAAEFLARCRASGKEPCLLFSLPGVTPQLAQPDWMHTVDQGIAQDIIGHVFTELLPEFPGNSRQEQCRQLWCEIRAWYIANNVPYRFDNMKLSMFVRQGQPNKLAGKAACTRHLVPFLPIICNRFWENGTLHQKAVCHLVQLLADCYLCLEKAPFDQHSLEKASVRLVNLYCSLEQEALLANPKSMHWRVKPKLHLFEELCQYGTGNPKDTWVYRDEDLGGQLALLFTRRGGPDIPGTNAARALDRWCCSCPVPGLQSQPKKRGRSSA